MAILDRNPKALDGKRLQLPYGTDDRKVIAGIRKMLTEMDDDPKHGWQSIRSIAERKLTLLQAYEKWTPGKALTPDGLVMFEPAAYDWLIEYQKEGKSATTIERYRETFNGFRARRDRKGETIKDPANPIRSIQGKPLIKKGVPMLRAVLENFPLNEIPTRLQAYRSVCLSSGSGEQFNKTRNNLSAFVDNYFPPESYEDEHHPLYVAVRKVKPIPVTFKKRSEAVPVGDVLAMQDKLPPKVFAQFWTMCIY